MEDTTFSTLFLYSLAFLFLIITVLSIVVYLAKQAAGKQYGKGHPKLNPESGSAIPKRDTAEMQARSTVGQIAAKAKVPKHKAAQAGSASD
jgi:hypothetical protein